MDVDQAPFGDPSASSAVGTYTTGIAAAGGPIMGPNERHSILKEIQVGSTKGESDTLTQDARLAAKLAATVGSSALAPEGFKYCGGANMNE